MSVPKLPPVKSHNKLVKFASEVDPLTKNEFFEDGRFYLLADSKVEHQLPAPSKLRPYIDRPAGQTDTWPAHSTMLPSAIGDGQLVPKPKFLQKLECYLQKELRALGCSDDNTPSERRLQAFREVFQYLIEDFRTYKPLLSVIKHEYESMLNSQKEVIRDLEPLKAMLVNLNQQCEQKVLSLKQEEKLDILNLKNENDRLENSILFLNDEIVGLQAQVKKCQSEVAIEYKRYRDESDARKLLIQDVNDMKYQQDEAKRILAGVGDKEGKKEDSVMLRIALRKAREDLASKTQRLAEVMADYVDVIPRRDFEKLESQFKSMEDGYDVIKKDHETLIKEHSTLIEVHKKVIEQRDNLAIDCEKMRRSATPRPDWSKCALYIEGGSDRWNELATETSSTNDKVDILLAELTGQDISAIKNGGGAMVDFFEPKGDNEIIPKYLQSTERVRNRRLNKRDLCIMIKDIWQEKIKSEGSTPFTDHSSMDMFLYEYLKGRFSLDNLVTEWGYNIHDAATRYSADPNVGVFAGVLNKEIDEDVYYCDLSQLEELYRVFAKADTNDTGMLSKEDFSHCLSSYFPSYTADNVSDILKAAEEELDDASEEQLWYKDLFTEDDEGKTGPFITCVKKLAADDRINFLQQVETCLGNNEITPEEIRDAFYSVDSRLSQKLCEQYTKLAFRPSSETEELSELKLTRSNVMHNLCGSCIRRT